MKRVAERLPGNITQLPSSTYKNPESLPRGDVLVVGSGQSGCQIAEDLHLAGRRVHLSVGGAPRTPRRYRGKELSRGCTIWEPKTPPLELDYVEANISAVIWCMGFRSDYSWVEIPIFDGKGYPSHQRGVTAVAGVYFLGLPWQYTWGSGRFSGVAQDAWFLADCIEARSGASPQDGGPLLNELAFGS
jgi:hypothetical protein